jgi:hypothetical protein
VSHGDISRDAIEAFHSLFQPQFNQLASAKSIHGRLQPYEPPTAVAAEKPSSTMFGSVRKPKRITTSMSVDVVPQKDTHQPMTTYSNVSSHVVECVIM